ncbi:uncharacterized protein [Parasteatoda tepidariorum]|uniref:uncharacterized protein n=1 Tax=Parasteatoda tepidariorum TaxID=114398 RepID=UPI00077F89EE|nr:uncharacterized protein LOC107439254 [Parasteatoda tepidariorum]
MANIYFHKSIEDPYIPLPVFPPIHPAELKSSNFDYNLPIKGVIKIFTDGYRLIYIGEYKVGCAFVIYVDGGLVEYRNFRLTDYSTVFNAELWMILLSLQWMHQININSETNIYSDSHSSFQALSNTNTNDYLVQMIKNTFNSITKFHWIKAHKGYEGNEEADRQAKLACQKSTIDQTCQSNRHAIKTDNKNRTYEE